MEKQNLLPLFLWKWCLHSILGEKEIIKKLCILQGIQKSYGPPKPTLFHWFLVCVLTVVIIIAGMIKCDIMQTWHLTWLWEVLNHLRTISVYTQVFLHYNTFLLFQVHWYLGSWTLLFMNNSVLRQEPSAILCFGSQTLNQLMTWRASTFPRTVGWIKFTHWCATVSSSPIKVVPMWKYNELERFSKAIWNTHQTFREGFVLCVHSFSLGHKFQGSLAAMMLRGDLCFQKAPPPSLWHRVGTPLTLSPWAYVRLTPVPAQLGSHHLYLKSVIPGGGLTGFDCVIPL